MVLAREVYSFLWRDREGLIVKVGVACMRWEEGWVNFEKGEMGVYVFWL